MNFQNKTFAHPATGRPVKVKQAEQLPNVLCLELESPYHPKGRQEFETLYLHDDGESISSCSVTIPNKTPTKTKIIGFFGSCL